MKKTSLLPVIILFFLLNFCSTNPPPKEAASPLEGVWELVAGKWEMQDSTYIFPSPGNSFKSRKHYSNDYFFVIGENSPIAKHYALAGTYSLKEYECIENIQFSSFDNLGPSPIIEFTIKNDSLTLQCNWFRETWVRLE